MNITEFLKSMNFTEYSVISTEYIFQLSLLPLPIFTEYSKLLIFTDI